MVCLEQSCMYIGVVSRGGSIYLIMSREQWLCIEGDVLKGIVWWLCFDGTIP